MPQAKVLSDGELKRVLAVVGQERYAARNRVALLLSFYAGMRVGEIAHLKVGDVVARDGSVKEEIRLLASYTKGRQARTVYVNRKLRRELQGYVETLPVNVGRDRALLQTQKGRGFSPNTLCQLFSEMYRRAGIEGASSHSGRRWFITRLAEGGTSTEIIMHLAGHRQMSTTQRYIEVTVGRIQKAVERIA